MKLSERERRLLILLVPSLLISVILRVVFFSDTPANTAPVSGNSVAMANRRLSRLREIGWMLPAREAEAKQSAADLAVRERGIIQAETAAQAQARLLEVARQIGKAEQIDVRGGDFGQPKVFGEYGLVYATISFDCHIDQLVNFLAALSKHDELIAPSEERISSGSAKEKLMNVRLVLAGVVAKKLVPEKKGLASY